MIDFAKQLLLKRTANIRVIVTPRWKEEMQQQIQAQIDRADAQLQQLEAALNRQIMEIQRQSLQPMPPQVQQEIENLRLQANSQRAEILEQKNQLLQQLNQVQVIELGQEVYQGQLDSFFPIGVGENLIATMNVEIVLRDGVIEDIRTGFPQPQLLQQN
jgi:exonuclease VII large subunit